MLAKTIKGVAIILLLSYGLQAAYNGQAEKDRKGLIKYMEKKFSDPVKNQNEFFPYYPKNELKKKFAKGLKKQDFVHGNYAYHKPSKEQKEELDEFPPYEFEVDAGEKLFNTPFANGKTYADCLGGSAVKNKYPYYDTDKDEVVTIEQAINECRTSNGEKPLKWNKGPMAQISGYISTQSRGQKVDVKIPSKKAAQAYERGKEIYYTKRGYLNNSCATCHVQGAGQRVRVEQMSPLLGAATNYPTYRIKWQGLGTLHRRLTGCYRDQGMKPLKSQSAELKELEYFLTYMSNGLEYFGPDIRK